MPQQAILVPELRNYITDETFIAMGFPLESWQRRTFWPLVWPPTHQFAKLGAKVDSDTRNYGIVKAARNLQSRFVQSVEVRGLENIPQEGPLLIASNHPGAYDSVVIVGHLPREDLKVIVSGVPFLKALPSLSQYLIFTAREAHGRMGAVRKLIRHMESGGVSLIFSTGIVDPDPDVLPGAYQALDAWSPSLELILRKVPNTKILVTIVSGVLAPACFRNPITRLAKEEWRRRKLAEFIQVMQQLFYPRRFILTPRISFGVPKTIDELRAQGNDNGVMGAIIGQARGLLETHTYQKDLVSGA